MQFRFGLFLILLSLVMGAVALGFSGVDAETTPVKMCADRQTAVARDASTKECNNDYETPAARITTTSGASKTDTSTVSDKFKSTTSRTQTDNDDEDWKDAKTVDPQVIKEGRTTSDRYAADSGQARSSSTGTVRIVEDSHADDINNNDNDDRDCCTKSEQTTTQSSAKSDYREVKTYKPNPTPLPTKTHTVYHQEPKKEVVYVAPKTVSCADNQYWDGGECVTRVKAHRHCENGHYWNGVFCESTSTKVVKVDHGCADGSSWNGNACVVKVAAERTVVPVQLPATGPGSATALSLFGIVGSLLAYKPMRR